ncbi:hypothetical protein EIN_051600 [Entamoeba invadens IP1]|uniref:hypothetical protein n=1 Tax=Entamoeba invadens IP1 TaxID=370355 RepID=UPI0002C3DA41|nr:hypothetical protein EIN_051600 [Entamoeba invadens IP1]ELP92995.1 hypothetical protein EIN_051600 [Entamoeba invadens IP1]|eukprot:XP_004259766.1 hypothetical protein EIN_051600 [Entamoeba invadens IP1]
MSCSVENEEVELWQVLSEKYFVLLRCEEYHLTRQTIISKGSLLYKDERIKLINLAKTLFLSVNELKPYINQPISNDIGQDMLQYFGQKLPVPVNYLKQALFPLVVVTSSVMNISKKLELEVNDQTTYVIALPAPLPEIVHDTQPGFKSKKCSYESPEEAVTLYDTDLTTHEFYTFPFSYCLCLGNDFIKKLSIGKHTLYTSNNNVLVAFNGDYSTIDVLVEKCMDDETKNVVVEYSKKTVVKIRDTNGRLLKYPSRGKHCHHTNYYEIQNVVKHVVQYCTCLCGTTCSYNDIIIDPHMKDICENAGRDSWYVEINGNEVRYLSQKEGSSLLSEVVEID